MKERCVKERGGSGGDGTAQCAAKEVLVMETACRIGAGCEAYGVTSRGVKKNLRFSQTFLVLSTRKTSNGVSHVGALQYAGQHADHIKCPHLAKITPRAAAAARGRGVSQLGPSVTMVSHPPRCSYCRVSTQHGAARHEAQGTAE